MSTSVDDATHLNRLAKAKSPYLLQHASNPVDWFEWGPEAFEKAKAEDKPIFLSVGYSACHWCHVLAHESFEDEVTAKLMNKHFINIKVDREERPDVDRLYMTFLQATSGGGGWPMSVWLTPDLHPFFAGTYFPPGRFRHILTTLAEAWEDKKAQIIETGQDVVEQLRSMSSSIDKSSAPTVAIDQLTPKLFKHLSSRFDSTYGGFGGAPKFPSPAQTLVPLSRIAIYGKGQTEKDEARKMGLKTLTGIYHGGVRDIVGNGFARYSVDERWHVPHFEKMLYDQAQLLSSCIDFYLIATDEEKEDKNVMRKMAENIITYVDEKLRSSDGGFWSAEDADSLPSKDATKPKEGAFYVWESQEIEQVIDDSTISEILKYHLGVKQDGNCDPKYDAHGELVGKNVLYVAHTLSETAAQFNKKDASEVVSILEEGLKRLREWREEHRPRPYLDDKILTGWNGLMISALSKASEHLPPSSIQGRALQLAEDAARFIRSHSFNEENGELSRSYRDGKGPIGQADDYAFLIMGLLDLYESSGNEMYLIWAVEFQRKQDELFYDEEGGGYFASAPDEHVIIRMKDTQDGAEPSSTSITYMNLCRLSYFIENPSDRTAYISKAESILKSHEVGQLLPQAPFVFGTLVADLISVEDGMRQFIVTSSSDESEKDKYQSFLRTIRSHFIPNRVLVHINPQSPPNSLARLNETVMNLVGHLDQEKANVRICEGFQCGLPLYEVADLEKELERKK
ncbi:hypothetical protein C8Q75DRAFT_717233 [Abortiporus biennis]|nr:hypothetical protein C8Q75DRAFT_717233 [Abortiporus biennis]